MDKLPWLAAETGVLSGSTITLSGAAIPFTPYPSRTFALAAADVTTTFDSADNITVLVVYDPINWRVYRHAVWVSGSPNTIDLTNAVLAGTVGTISDSSIVKVIAVSPDLVNIRRAVPANDSAAGFEGDWAYDETDGYFYRWIATNTVIRFVAERDFGA